MHSNFLDGVPFLAGLSLVDRNRLAELFSTRPFKANEPIFWVGDEGDEFFVIRSGRVKISVPDVGGKEITLADLGTGDVFGEISLLDAGPRTATARATAESVLLALSRDSFDQFINGCPQAALHMMRVLGKRQRQTVEKLRGIKNLNEVIQERLTRWQRIAMGISSMASSQIFLMAHAIAFGAWIFANASLGARGVDPFPFPFLCFWTSSEAIFLSLFILVAQDQQARKDRARTELEYQVALKTHLELMQLHQKMDRLIDERSAQSPTGLSGDAASSDLPAPMGSPLSAIPSSQSRFAVANSL